MNKELPFIDPVSEQVLYQSFKAIGYECKTSEDIRVMMTFMALSMGKLVQEQEHKKC